MLGKSLDFYGKTEKKHTQHIAKLAYDYGLAGVVGFAGEAQSTLQNQKLLAMGITQDGKSYETRETRLRPFRRGSRNNEAETRIVKKRSRTPASALQGASFLPDGTCNTSLLLGHAVKPTDEGGISDSWHKLGSSEKLEIMRGNILAIEELARIAVQA